MSATKISVNASRYSALFLASCIPAAVFLVPGEMNAASDTSQKEARVTRIIRDVKLLPSKSTARPAAVNDKVNEGTGVRTGDESRSELTFVDLTITRLGANSIFSFNKAGRNVELGDGSMLLRVPKDSGGARISTSAVTVGITGTTVILESTRAGRNKLIVLEGGARLRLNKHSAEPVYVRGGQMEDVPAGATALPQPVEVDLDQIMKKHPLITDFPPLPSRDLIYATQAQRSPPVYQGQPPGGGLPGPVSVFVPILGNVVGSGPVRSHTGRSRTTQPNDTHRATGGEEGYNANPSQTKKTGATGAQANAYHAKPSPTPSRRKKPHKN